LNISEFCQRLHSALAMRGLSEEEISDCIAGIVPSIESSSAEPDEETFNAVVSRCVEIIETKRKNSTPPVEEEISVPSFGEDVATASEVSFCGDSDGIVPVSLTFGGNDDETAVSAPVFGTSDDDEVSVPEGDASATAFGDTVTIPSIHSFTSENTAHNEVSVPTSVTATADTVTVPITNRVSRKNSTTVPAPAKTPVVPDRSNTVNDVTVPDTPSEEPPAPMKKVKSAPAPKVKLSSKGRIAFIGITVLTSPLWGLFFLLFFMPFILLYILESVTIAALIAGVAGISAAGTAASLTGIVYGVIRSFAVFSEGLYEIGFGVIVAGVTMIVGILLFNAAVRFMPWLFRKTAVFSKFLVRHAASIFSIYKRRFEKL